MAALFRNNVPRRHGSTEAVISRAVETLGGLKPAAALIQRSVSALHQTTNPNIPHSLGYEHVRKMTQAGADAFVEDLCAIAGGAFLPQAKPNADFASLISTYCGEHGELLARSVAAIADGKVTSIESADLLRDIDDAIRALIAARVRLLAPAETTAAEVACA